VQMIGRRLDVLGNPSPQLEKSGRC
jgi:hypothetical protein